MMIKGIFLFGYWLFCSVFALVFLLQPQSAYAQQNIRQYVDNGGYAVRDSSGLVKFRAQDLFIPASTLKVLTCLVALEKLGKEYRFETHFFLDEQNNLYIKGYGDPFLTSEAILEIGKVLRERGIRQLESLFLDDSSFALDKELAGDETSANPYDAPNGALAVNFNAVPIQVAGDATISSGEPQTPLIPLMTEAGTHLPKGVHRINIDSFTQPGQLPLPLRYTGELFTAQFKKLGISAQKGYSRKIVPDHLKPLYIYHSIKSLDEIIRACLENSNNYIANQLFLACGIKDYGLPATWEKSRQSFAIFARDSLQLSSLQISVVEGSGLSRKNRISPAAFLAVLDQFKPYSYLLNRQNDILVKSGTMKDVYCYAGYFPQGNELFPFAILLNQSRNNRSRILKVLRSALQDRINQNQ